MTARSEASVGARLRRARSRKGLTGRDLAGLIDVSPATMSQLENDKAQLSVQRLETIAEVLGVSAADVLEDRGVGGGADSPSLPTPAEPPHGGQWRQYGSLRFGPILAAALEEFLEVGYHGTTMRRIATRCGVSVPGIYGHYPSKQALLMRVLDETMDDLEWRAAAAIAEGDGPVGRFSNAIENLALYHTYRRDLGFIGASEVRALEPDNRALVTGRRDRQQYLVDEQVHEGVKAGVFRTAIPDDAARVVVSMCAALPTWWHPDGRLGPEAVASEYVDFALSLVGYSGR